MLLDTAILTSFALLLLRLIVAIIFFSSGKRHIQDPIKRGERIGMTPSATTLLGVIEIVGALSIFLGIYTQIGAALLIVAMIGTLYKKIFVWKNDFMLRKVLVGITTYCFCSPPWSSLPRAGDNTSSFEVNKPQKHPNSALPNQRGKVVF